MTKFVRPDMSRTGFETDSVTYNPEIDDKLGRNLSYLVGYCDDTETYELVALDSDRRVLVSSGATKTDEGNISIATADSPAILALQANPDRQMFIIQNTSSQTIWLGFDENVDDSNGFPLASGGVWENNVWIGVIYAYANDPDGTLAIIEMS